MGSLFQDFLDNITPDSPETIQKALVDTATSVANVADKVIPDPLRSKQVYQAGQGVVSQATNENNPLGYVFGGLTAPFTKPVEIGSKVLMAVDTYAISRPTSTVMQATYANNPLYRDGLQLQDFVDMWNASEIISPGQAMVWRTMDAGVASMLNPVQAIMGRPGGSPQDTFANNNIYDPERRAQLEQNTLWTIGTGAEDAAFQIAVGGKGVDALANGARRAAGLNTLMDGARDLNKLNTNIANHILHTETGGVEGKWSTAGYWVDKAAEETDPGKLLQNPMINTSSRPNEIANMLAGVRDSRTVARVLLADRGDRNSIGALIRQDPDFAWTLGRMTERLQKQILETGQSPLLTKNQAAVIDRVFDNVIERQPTDFYRQVRDNFLSTERAVDETAPEGFYTATSGVQTRRQPMSRLAGRAQIGMTEARANARLGKPVYEAPENAGWMATQLGNFAGSRPATVLLQYVGGRRPEGQFSWSASTPADAIDELLSQAGRLSWTRGNRTWTFMRDGQEVSMAGPQWREEAISKLTRAAQGGDLARNQAMQEIEQDFISGVITRFGLTPDQATQLAGKVMIGKQASLDQAHQIGFWFDDEAKLLRLDPAFRRQLPDTYTFFPIEDFAREAQHLTSTGLPKALRTARHSVDSMYELIQKYVRLNQLFRISYTPKNAMAEPIGAGIADLGIDAMGGTALDAAKGFPNFMVNRARQLGSIAYWTGDTLRVTKGKKINREMAQLHQDAANMRAQIDRLESMKLVAESGERSPAEIDALYPRIDAELRDLGRRYQQIAAKLNADDPGWQSALDAPSISVLSNEVSRLERFIDNPQLVEDLRSQVQIASDAAATRHANTVAEAQARIPANQARIAEIESQIAYSKDPFLAGALDNQRSVEVKLQDLRLAERRLAWAERVSREGVQDYNGTARSQLQARIERLRVQRADEEIRLSAGTQDMLTSTAPSSPKLDRIDAQLASLQQQLADLSVVPGGVPFAAQEVLDKNPALIARLRSELGDLAPKQNAVYDDVEKELLGEISATQSRIATLQHDTSAQVRDLEQQLPKMAEVDGQPRFMPTEEDKALYQELARRQVMEDEKVADNYLANVTDPASIGDLPLSLIHSNIADKEGLVPLKWVIDMLEDKPVKIRARKVRRKAADGTIVSEVIPARVVDNPRGGLTLDQFALWLKTGFTDPDAARAAGRELDWLEIPGVGEIRQGAVLRKNKDGSADNTEYFRLPWMRTNDDRAAKIQDLADSMLVEHEQEMENTYYRVMDELEAVKAEAAEQESVHRDWLRQVRAGLADHRAGKETPQRVNYTLNDPLPGPYNVRLLEREKADLERDIEQAKRVASSEYRDPQRLAALRKDLTVAERLAVADPETIAGIRGLREQLTTAGKAYNAVGPALNPLAELDKLAEQLTAIYGKIDVVRKRSLPMRARREAMRERKHGREGENTFNVGGSKLIVPDWYAPNAYGEATRAEMSASYVNRLTMDPTRTGIANAQRIAEANKMVEISPDNPRFFHELAYAANRHVTGDPLARLLLQGANDAAVIKWLATPEGMKYTADMQWKDSPVLSKILKSIPDAKNPDKRIPVTDRSWIGNARQMINRYFPTEEAKQAVLAGEVTPVQLEKALASIPTEQLSPVAGRALEYVFQDGKLTGALRSFTDKAWDNLATKPENFLARFPIMARWLDREMQARLQMLADQGIDVSVAEFNAMRKSVIAAGVKETRKTFYNTNRINNLTYAARYLLVYPQAVFNTLYRAARLTYNRPGTAMVMNNAWTGFFTTHGVDKDGKPTKDYSKVENLIFNVPEWAQYLGVDKQAKLPAKTFELVSDRVGATWTVQVPLQTLIMYKPSANEALKAVLGEGYKSIFPFGTPSGLSDTTIAGIPAQTFIPNYARALYSAVTMSTDQFVRVHDQILQYELASYEARLKLNPNGDIGPKPTLEDTARKAAFYWAAMAVAQFSITGGGGLQPIGQVERDQINRIVQRNNGDREAALPEVMQQFPNLEASIINQGTSKYNVYIPSTLDAYTVVTDPKLQPLLGDIVGNRNGGDPELVSLLVGDKNGVFDPNVYDALQNLYLPGSTVPVSERAPAEQIMARADAQKSWATFNASRTALMAEVARRGLTSIPDELQKEWSDWLYGTEDQPGFADKPENQYMMQQYESRDDGVARRSLDVLTLGLQDPAMEKYRGTPYWLAVDKYLNNLPTAQQAYRDAKGKAAKDAVMAEWDMYVNQTFGAVAPDFISKYNQFLAGDDVKVK